MSDFDFELPPRRTLPPEVRGRIRARVRSGLDQPRRTRLPRTRAPFAVAAGVVVLAAGAMIVAQSVNGGSGEPGQRTTPPTGSSTAPRPLDVPAANAQLDRCWAVIQAEGRAKDYPDRSRWRALSSGGYMWVTVTAAAADGKAIFCQTSVTTARVSQPTTTPAYIQGSTTAALFISPEGIVAGVRDPSWPGVGIFVGEGGAVVRSAVDLLPYGLFVGITRDRMRDGTKIEVDRWRDRAEHPERLTLPRPQAPVSRVDRPAPPKDRTSDRGQWLKQCLDSSQSPVVDADMWEPGAMVDIEGSRYMVLRSGRDFAYCFNDGTNWGFGESVTAVNDFGANEPHMLPGPNALESHRDKTWITGALPDAVTRVDVLQGTNPVVHADVVNGTFAALLAEPPDRSNLVRAYDAAGNQLYETTLY